MKTRTDGLWLRDVFVDAYYDSGPLIVANVLWFALTLPLVTAPPAAAGLYYVTNQLAHRRSANWRTFFEGFRTYFWLGWRWGLVNLLVLSVIGANYWFYARIVLNRAEWIEGIFLSLAMLWGILQTYTFPLLLEQKDRRMVTAVRNSVVLYLKYPAFSIGLAVLVLLLLVVSSLLLQPAWIFLTAGLCAYLTNRGAIFLVDRLQA
jgi:uncharacterized membrane protein YesL